MRKAQDGGCDRETRVRALTRRTGSSMLAGTGPYIPQLAMWGWHLDSQPVALPDSFDEIFHRRRKNAAVSVRLKQRVRSCEVVLSPP